MRTVSVLVEEELFLEVKRQALETGVTLTEVMRRLLQAYVEGRINVKPREPKTPTSPPSSPRPGPTSS